MSYVDAGYAVALGTLLPLRGQPGPAPPALGAGAEGCRSAGRRGRRRFAARRAVVTETTTEPSPPPSPPTSEAAGARPCPRRGDGRPAAGSWSSSPSWSSPSSSSSSRDWGARSTTSTPSTRPSPTGRRSAPRPSDSRVRWSRGPSTPRPPAPTSSISEGANVVHVTNTGSPPQLFQARIPVVVVGHFTIGDLDTRSCRTPSWSSTRRPTPPSTRAGSKVEGDRSSADGRRPPRHHRDLARLRGEHRRHRCASPSDCSRATAPPTGRPHRSAAPDRRRQVAGAGDAGRGPAGRRRHGARARHPRLHAGVRGREQQHGHPVAVLHHRDVVRPGRLHPAVGPHPRRGHRPSSCGATGTRSPTR